MSSAPDTPAIPDLPELPELPAPAEVRQPAEAFSHNDGSDQLLTEDDLVKLTQGTQKERKRAVTALVSIMSVVNAANAFRKTQDPEATVADRERFQNMLSKVPAAVLGESRAPGEGDASNGVRLLIETGGGAAEVSVRAAAPPVPPPAGALDHVKLKEGGDDYDAPDTVAR